MTNWICDAIAEAAEFGGLKALSISGLAGFLYGFYCISYDRKGCQNLKLWYLLSRECRNGSTQKSTYHPV